MFGLWRCWISLLSLGYVLWHSWPGKGEMILNRCNLVLWPNECDRNLFQKKKILHCRFLKWRVSCDKKYWWLIGLRALPVDRSPKNGNLRNEFCHSHINSEQEPGLQVRTDTVWDPEKRSQLIQAKLYVIFKISHSNLCKPWDNKWSLFSAKFVIINFAALENKHTEI